MAEKYDYCRHTHCTIKLPDTVTATRAEDWTEPLTILAVTGAQMATNDRVWFHGCYSHELFPGVVRVSDGLTTGFDPDGNCILSVPIEWCTFYTEEEARQIETRIEEERKLTR